MGKPEVEIDGVQEHVVDEGGVDSAPVRWIEWSPSFFCLSLSSAFTERGLVMGIESSGRGLLAAVSLREVLTTGSFFEVTLLYW